MKHQCIETDEYVFLRQALSRRGDMVNVSRHVHLQA